MEKVITKDGSVTYYNSEVQDHYHTKSGAKEEAIEKHAKALGIKEGTIIYDICFGLGYNTAAAMDLAKKLTIYCFENDKEILKKILEIKADFKSWKIIQRFVSGSLKGKTEHSEEGYKLIMMYGDARELIKKVKEKADYIFFDPFSPAKVPEMWTEKFLRNMKLRMNKGGKLSTYSCARFVRENMKNAGLFVTDGPVIGRRSPSTIATNRCEECGVCCKLFMINLNKEEYESGKYETMYEEKVEWEEAELTGANIIAQKEDGSCWYLKNGKCLIHEKRPAVCKEFYCDSEKEQYKKMIELINKKKSAIRKNI